MPLGRSGAADPTAAALARPWRFAGWTVLILLLCFVFLPCVIWIGILFPAYEAAESRKSFEAQKAVLTIRFDEDTPLIEFDRSPVSSNPFDVRYSPGRYVVGITYLRSGQRYSFEHVIEIGTQEHKSLDLGPIIRQDFATRRGKGDEPQGPAEENP